MEQDIRSFEKYKQEIIIIFIVSILSFCFFSKYDVLEKTVKLSSEYENFEIDEIMSSAIVTLFCITLFSLRRVRDLKTAIHLANKSNKDINSASDKTWELKGILPFCTFCKKIRNDSGDWEEVDIYIGKHSKANISHSICTDCIKQHYPDYTDEIN